MQGIGGRVAPLGHAKIPVAMPTVSPQDLNNEDIYKTPKGKKPNYRMTFATVSFLVLEGDNAALLGIDAQIQLG